MWQRTLRRKLSQDEKQKMGSRAAGTWTPSPRDFETFRLACYLPVFNPVARNPVKERNFSLRSGGHGLRGKGTSWTNERKTMQTACAKPTSQPIK